jgi:hypothetical protein
MMKKIINFWCQFAVMSTAVIIVLKLANEIAWPWPVVLSAIWMPLLLAVLIVGTITIVDLAVKKLP